MIKENLELDEKDRQIICLLEENPEISQNEIARHVGISQPSVGVRIRKLREKGVISSLIGMNFKKVGLYLAKVDVTAKNTAEILDFFKGCPYFLNGLIVSGESNLCLFFMSEDINTIEAIVDGHLRSDPHVAGVNLSIVIAPSSDFIFPVRMKFKKQEQPPCGYGKKCGNCPYYTSDRCLGCPATGFYKGKFW